MDQNTRHTQGGMPAEPVVSRMSGPPTEATQDRPKTKDTDPDPG